MIVPAELQKLYTELDVPKLDWGLNSGRAIAFAHGLRVPAGPHTHEKLRLRPFQIQFIRDVYNPVDRSDKRKVRQAILSVARRNGKTLLAAVLVLLHLAGPFKRPNSTLYSAATTRKQAGIVYRFVRDIIKVSASLRGDLHYLDSTKHVVHQADGSMYAAISAEAGGQFGEGLDFVVYDELSQSKSRALYDALMTSLGSQPEPLMMIISTQAPTDQHLLSELIDYGLKIKKGTIKDDSFVCHLHTVPIDAEITDKTQWKKANPALNDYRSLKELADAVNRAKQIPSLESSVRVYYLNQRVQQEDAFLAPDVWDRNSMHVAREIFTDGRPVFGGLDLSARIDLSALVLACEDDDGSIPLLPFAWTPKDTLLARAIRDRAPYDAWARMGFLATPPGQSIDYEFVARDIAEITQGMNLIGIAYDRWRIAELKQAAARLGIFLPLSEMGQGFKDMAPAVSAFEALALDGKLRHGGHPVLKWCVSNTVIVRDAAGNRKPDKARAFGRIDLSVAAIMAVARMKTQAAPVDIAAMIA